MDSEQQRKHDLGKNIQNELKLQKELEDELRLAQEPQHKQKIKNQIEEVKIRIIDYKKELNSFTTSRPEEQPLAIAMTNITFKELTMVTQGILCMPIPNEENFSLLPPLKKMQKNELTGVAQSRLMTGVIQAKMVGKFVEHMVSIIPDFPEKLKSGFIKEYQRLRGEGLNGNALLDALHDFSCNHSSDYDLQAAGLAVLYYLFEKCEVFER